MHLTTYSQASDFLHDNRPYLEAQEVVNGLILGLAARLVDDPLAYGSPPYMAAVADGGEPVLAALMTPPHNLILYASDEPVAGALALVAQDLRERRWPVSGTLGPVSLAEAFASTWAAATGAGRLPGMSQRIYELRQVIPPQPVAGALRYARESDVDLVAGWWHGFEVEALHVGTPEGAEANARRRIANGSVALWDDGGPVSMAMRNRPTRHGVTVSGVYTPPTHRRRGYASACVAALSQGLLDAGYEFCTLFTNLANPTSNHIYQEIGYRPVCDFQEIKFTSPGSDAI